MRALFLLLLTILSSSEALASNTSCSYILGYATQNPGWITFTGAATINAETKNINVELYNDKNELSFTLRGELQKNKLNAIFLNKFSDEGEILVEGNYEKFVRSYGAKSSFTESLVVQNPYVFVAVTCHKKIEN
ncbi:MAG: hypothetical protein V4629_03430 [Pseudomonadota bacterium]